MREFLEAIWPNERNTWGELRKMRNGQVEQAFYGMDVLDLLVAEAAAWSRDGWDCYIGALPRVRPSGRAEDCVTETQVLIADIDNKNVGGGHLAALLRVGQLNLTPSIIVDSGNGIHCWWLLRTPQAFEAVQPLMKGLQAAIGSDRVHDAPRVLRLPGTLNHKDCQHGTVHDPLDQLIYCKPVRLLHFEPDRRYRLSDFDHFTPEEPRPVHYEPLSDSAWEPSSPTAPKFSEGSRNNELTRLAGIMSARGMQPIDMLAALLRENAVRCSPPLPSAEVERIVRSVSRYARG